MINTGALITIGIYLLVIAAVGVWAAIDQKRARTGQKTENYYVGGRRLGPLVLIFTILASAASAGTFIGGPGLVYHDGIAFLLMALFQVPTVFLTVGLLGKKYAILARKLNFYTFIDIFKQRFESRTVTTMAGIGIVIFLGAYMVAQYAGGAHILHAVTGVPYSTLVVVFAALVAVYTSFGGFMGASVNDTVQGIIMFVGGLILWVAVFASLGTATPMNSHFAEKFPQLLTLPGGTGANIGTFISFALIFGLLVVSSPHVAIRAMSYRDSKTAHSAIAWSPIIMYVMTIGFSLMGLMARYFAPALKNPDLAIPTIITQTVNGPLAGILLSAPLAAIMSTVSSMLLVVSGAVVRDIVRNLFVPKMTDQTSSRTSVGVSLVIGLATMVVALKPPEALELIVIFALSGLGAFFTIPFFGALYWRRATAAGAFVSMLSGLIWYIVGQQWLPSLGAGMDPVVTALIVSAVLFVAVSLLTKRPPRHVIVKFWGTQAEIDKLEPKVGQ
ncbi:sodium/pantothenate symporter [Spelaeicoccus albus]|uniref:Sodium/pantothenate symporter n=1 Tax=Spelaeicoccus albus TaxID=1280376 RepID=A0A7Z0D4R1_9MICO|nr:sodium/pantothenate symporter [Spelaeicoccus albus]NYI68815.1 sodium/pantothenate symporter [Spelaeicoccus albus]